MTAGRRMSVWSGLLVLALLTLSACAATTSQTRRQQIERRAGIYEAYTRAQLARHLGDLEASIRHAREAVALAPNDEHLVVTLGAVLRVNNQYDEAREVLEAGIELIDEPVSLYLELASVLELLDDPVSADGAYQSALLLRPAELQPVRQYAGFASRVRSRNRAVEIIETYLRHQAEDADGWRLLGQYQAEAGHTREAIDAYVRATELDPHNEADYVPVLRLARETDERELGERYATECFEVYRQNVSCRVEYIRFLDAIDDDPEDLARGRTFEVLQSLGRAIGANVNRLRRVERRILNELDADRALVFLASVAADRPRNTQIQARAAWAAYRVGDEELACEYMTHVLDVNPRSADALNFIGYSYAERGIRLDEAESLVLRALELRPDDGNIQDSLGWVYFHAGRLDEAVRWLERAVQNVPDNAVLRDHLADAYRRGGQTRDALKQYLFARALADETLREAIQLKIDEIEASLSI